MLTRILVIVSCNFAYWQYSDGTQSVLQWNHCGEDAEMKATLEDKRREERRKLAHRLRMAKVRARARLAALRRAKSKPKCDGIRDTAARLTGKCR
jgi:hypothetical protein